jgi:hypothetical protein
MTDQIRGAGEALYREMPLVLIKREEARAAGDTPPDANVLRFSASSETPVMRFGDAEILRHDAASIRLDRLRQLGSALVNHDPDQRAAKILACDIVDARLEVEVRFGSTEFAQQIRQEVADGLLRGISIGYRVYGWDVNEETRTYMATDWEPFEVTFTPVPADASVGPGRSADAWGQLVRSITPTAARAASQEARVSDPVIPSKPAVEPAATPITKDEGARAAVIAEQRDIAQQAKSLALDAGDFVGMTRAEAQAAMLVKLAERTATAAPKQAPVATVDYDQADKARDAFTGALAHRANVRSESLDKHKVANPMIGRSLIEVFRRYAKMVGLNTEDWSREDVAYYALGKRDMMSELAQRSANVGTGQFTSFVFLNAITKIVARGFEMGSQTARYKRIVSEQTVPDFKQFSVGSLSSGNLQKTAELMTFPELDKAEGVYNSSASMWGGTLSLSLQALVSDDTASFERLLRMAGPIADKTIDRRVFQKLLMGTSAAEATSTWTNNTTSGGSLVYTTADLAAAARAKLGLVRAALINKAGKDGNPYGNAPRFLVVPVTREMEALGITGGSGPALQAGVAQQASSLEVVATPWLEASALTGYSTTSYYVIADPNEVTTLVVSKVRGFETVQVMPYDAGAVAGFNWKLFLPFEADLVYDLVSGTKYFPGAQQGTT